MTSTGSQRNSSSKLEPALTVTISGIPTLYSRAVKVFGAIRNAIGPFKATNLVIVRGGTCNVQFEKKENREKCLKSKIMMWGFSEPLKVAPYQEKDNVMESAGFRPRVVDTVATSPTAEAKEQSASSAQQGNLTINVGIFFLKKDITELHKFFTTSMTENLLPHERYTYVQLTSVNGRTLRSFPIGKRVSIQVVGLFRNGSQQSAIVQINDPEIAALCPSSNPTVTLACSDNSVVPQQVNMDMAKRTGNGPTFQGTLGYLNAENRVITSTMTQVQQ